MNRPKHVLAPLLVAVIASTTRVPAQFPSLLGTTAAGGNAQNGNMFDVENISSQTVTLLWLRQNFNTAGVCPSFEIYKKAGGGTYVGSETTAGAWTLVGATASLAHAGTGTLTLVPIPLNISIPPGGVQGLYVTSTAGHLVAYTNGTAVGNIAAADSNLRIREGAGKSYPFAGTFVPRIWNGELAYGMTSGGIAASISYQASCSALPKRVRKDLPHTITGTASGANPPVSWQWAMTGPSGNHTYTTNGTVNYTWVETGSHFIATLATDFSGASDYVLEAVEVCDEVKFEFVTGTGILTLGPPPATHFATASHGFTFVDPLPSGTLGSGPFLGLDFNPLILTALQSPPAIDNVFHFLASSSGYPDVAFVAIVPGLPPGLNLDVVVVYLDAASAPLHITRPARLAIL